MPKFIIRIVALLLVPCLLADPALAATRQIPGQAQSLAAATSLFTVQSIPPTAECFGQSEINRHSTVTIDEAMAKVKRSFSQMTRIKFIAILFGGARFTVAQMPEKSKETTDKTPLTSEQQFMLRKRVDFYATRVWPDMTDAQRQAVVDESRAESSSVDRTRPWHIFSLTALPVAMAAWILLLRWWINQYRAQSTGITRRQLYSVVVPGVFALIVLGLVTVREAVVLYLKHQEDHVTSAEVADGRIYFDEKDLKAIGTGRKFFARVNHELAHLFGDAEGSFHKLKRDAWLATAYASVMALDRGGTAELREISTGLDAATTDKEMVYFYLGFLLMRQHQNIKEAEEMLRSFVERQFGPINPDATSDSTDHSYFWANHMSALGMAGLAWAATDGDLDSAFLYLRLRGDGLRPEEAGQRAKESLLAKGGSRNAAAMPALEAEGRMFIEQKVLAVPLADNWLREFAPILAVVVPKPPAAPADHLGYKQFDPGDWIVDEMEGRAQVMEIFSPTEAKLLMKGKTMHSTIRLPRRMARVDSPEAQAVYEIRAHHFMDLEVIGILFGSRIFFNRIALREGEESPHKGIKPASQPIGATYREMFDDIFPGKSPYAIARLVGNLAQDRAYREKSLHKVEEANIASPELISRMKRLLLQVFVRTHEDLVKTGVLRSLSIPKWKYWSKGGHNAKFELAWYYLPPDVVEYAQDRFARRGLSGLAADNEVDSFPSIAPYYPSDDPRSLEDHFSQRILALHYDASIAEELAETYGNRIEELMPEMDSIEVVIPIPSRDSAGPASWLAVALARRLQKPIEPEALTFARKTEKQSSQKGFWARVVNAAGAFVGVSAKVMGRTILLMDDNATTGMTLQDSIRALYEAGAKMVHPFAWSQTARAA